MMLNLFYKTCFSCNNLTDATQVKKVKSFLVRKKGIDPSVVLYGMLQAYFKHKYDNEGSYIVDGEQRKDYYTLNKNERVYDWFSSYMKLYYYIYQI